MANKLRKRNRTRFESLESRHLLAAVTWDGGGDGETWHDPLNWNTDVVPGEFDDVVIDVPDRLVEIEVETGELASVNSLDVEERLFLRGPLEFQEASRFRQLRVQGADPNMLRGAGDMQIDESLEFRGGSVSGSGQITIGEDATFSVTVPTSLDEKSLELFGTANISHGLRGSAPIEIHPSATLNLFASGSSTSVSGFTGTQEVTNNGRIVQRGFGSGRVGFQNGARFINNGEIDLQGSGLEISGGGFTTTDIQIPSGSKLRFQTSDFRFGPGTLVFGDGLLELAGGGSYDFTESQLLVTGTLDITGGDIRVANTLPPQLFVNQIRGTNIFFDADQVFDSARVEFSVVAGAGQLQFRGNTFFQSVTFLNEGGILIPEDATVSFGSFATAQFATNVENFGRVLAGSRGLVLNGTFTNHVGGEVFIGAASGSNRISVNGNGVLINKGLFTKSGDGLSKITSTVTVENSGTIRVEDGPLQFTERNRTLSGRIEVLGDGVLETNLTLADSDTVLTGDGTIDGDLVNRGIVKPGNSVSGNGIGTLFVSGEYSQTATGTLELDVSGLTPDSEHDQLRVSQSASFAGNLTLQVTGEFEPENDDELIAVTYSSGSGEFSNVNVFGVPNTASSQIEPAEAKVTFSSQAGGVQPTFSGTAEPGSTVQLTSDKAGDLGSTTADPETGAWQIQVLTTLSNERHIITATDPNDPDAETNINVFADLNASAGEVDVADDISLRTGSIQFAPFGLDLDGVLEDDDIIIDVENGALTFDVLESQPQGTVNQAKRKFNGSIEFVDQDTIQLSGDFAESELLAGSLPFTITRFTYRLSADDGTIVNELTAFGRFRNPDLDDKAELAEKTAIEALQG
ncbi:MAG: hypothetical protein AAF802_12705, partial [Planctomycetota bacterium]